MHLRAELFPTLPCRARAHRRPSLRAEEGDLLSERQGGQAQSAASRPGFPSSLLVEDGSSLDGGQMLCFTAHGSGLSRATASARPHIGPAG